MPIMKQLLITIVALVLVGCGPNVNIHKAAEEGNISIIKQYLDDGWDVDANDSFDRTPLHRAAYSGQKEVAKLLIAKGADVNAKDDEGETPLIAAIHGSFYEYIKGGNGKDKVKRLNGKDTVKLLIENGADVNVGNVNSLGLGETPLHIAALAGKSEIIEFLIKAEADVNAKNSLGMTPMDSAMLHPKITDLLRKHGGKTQYELDATGN